VLFRIDLHQNLGLARRQFRRGPQPDTLWPNARQFESAIAYEQLQTDFRRMTVLRGE